MMADVTISELPMDEAQWLAFLDAIEQGGRNRYRVGEDNPAAKITLDTAKTIRSRYAGGGVSQRQLAREFSLSVSTVNDIITNKAWKSEDRRA